ncbi:unnamed protein product [Gordionus sp. m RMFG-2023]
MDNTALLEGVKVGGRGLSKTFEVNDTIIQRLVRGMPYTILMNVVSKLGNFDYNKTVNNTNTIGLHFPCDFNSYNISFYLTCSNLVNLSLIAFAYLKFDYSISKIERISYHKETPSLVHFNFSVPFEHMVQTFRMKLLAITTYNETRELVEFKEFTNLPLEYHFKSKGIYKLSFQFKICDVWLDTIEKIKHVKINDRPLNKYYDCNSIIFANLSIYNTKRSLLIMVFPKSLKESFKNGNMSKRNCSLILFVIAYDQTPRNITYMITYKTPQMNRPKGKYIIHQETRFKRPRDIPRANFENLEEFLQGIEGEANDHFPQVNNPAFIEDFLGLAQDVGLNNAIVQLAAFLIDPAIEEIAPLVEAVPVIGEVAAVMEDIAPVIEEVVPAIEGLAPIVEEVAAVEEVPVAGEGAAAIEGLAPIGEEAAAEILLMNFMLSILLRLYNTRIYVVAINIYVILWTCYGDMDNTAILEGVKVKGRGLSKTFEVNDSIIQNLIGGMPYTILMNVVSKLGSFDYNKTVNNINTIGLIFPCDFNSYNISFYLTCSNFMNLSLIAFAYLRFDYRISKIARISYHKETASLVHFNFSIPFDHMVQTFRMKLLAITTHNETRDLEESKEFTNLPLKYNFESNGIYKLSFQFKVCDMWFDTIETIKHVKIDSNSIIFANISTYRTKPSLLIMVFPRSLKESLRNGKMSKRNCSLTLVVVAYDQRSNQTEERNITYIISYKTPQMNRPNGKYIIHQKTRSKSNI